MTTTLTRPPDRTAPVGRSAVPAPVAVWQLQVARRAAARRYAVEVLGLVRGPATEAVVEVALERTPPGRGDEALVAAVRHQAWRAQRRAGRPARLAVGAAVLAVAALLAAGSVAAQDPTRSTVASGTGSPPGAVVRGQVVAADATGATVGRPGTVVRVRTRGDRVVATARTDRAGRFEVAGLEPGPYVVTIAVPEGYGVPGSTQADRLSATVDLRDEPETTLILRLERTK